MLAYIDQITLTISQLFVKNSHRDEIKTINPLNTRDQSSYVFGESLSGTTPNTRYLDQFSSSYSLNRYQHLYKRS